MAISKLILNGVTQMDVTSTTAVANDVAQGKNFILANGTIGTGTATPTIAITDVVDSVTGGTTRTISSTGYAADQIATNNLPTGVITLSSNITSIAKYAFAKKPITKIYGSEVTTIEEGAFMECSNLKEVDFPILTTVGSRAFYSSGLEEFISSSLNKVNSNLFENCSSLKKILLTATGTFTGNYWVKNCPALVELRTPNSTNTSMNGFGFTGNISIDIYDIGKSNQLYISNLPTTAPLSVLIMRKENGVVTFQTGASSLNSLAFAEGGTGGEIYIPEVLYNHLGDGTSLDYKANSAWAELETRGTVTWKKIEGSVWE